MHCKVLLHSLSLDYLHSKFGLYVLEQLNPCRVRSQILDIAIYLSSFPIFHAHYLGLFGYGTLGESTLKFLQYTLIIDAAKQMSLRPSFIFNVISMSLILD